jgi:hypothetical protein
MKKATRSLESHFKNLKEEKKIQRFLSNIGKKETRRERQEAWKVILKILRRKPKIEMFFSIIGKKGNI